MNDKCRVTGLAAGASLIVALSAAGAARADEGNLLAWSSASANVGLCQVGVTCGQPNGVTFLRREQFTAADVDFNNASVYHDDYKAYVNNAYFGNAFASAEAGEGLLGLPVLHALAASGSPNLGSVPQPVIGVSVGLVQAVQAYTNTSGADLVIPLDAFQGVVDYHVGGSVGTISAGLAITTSAILDSTVAGQWSAVGGQGHFGEFTADCGTTGALAFGQSGATNSGGSPNTQFLSVAATSCTGSDTFTLGANETFYVWARLGVVHSAIGVTDAANTFNVTIAPAYQQQVLDNLAPGLALASGANLDIPTADVPEPAAWALMILGFGAVGGRMRRRNAGRGLGRAAG